MRQQIQTPETQDTSIKPRQKSQVQHSQEIQAQMNTYTRIYWRYILRDNQPTQHQYNYIIYPGNVAERVQLSLWSTGLQQLTNIVPDIFMLVQVLVYMFVQDRRLKI
ncbi:Hypothetical_protein [Hexamita inflata]|uniref:Hypothetical_protein n=1 Tax=Hexamita inflata TaxID=28002 RepID=A0AA86RDZ2_9EUKA|nr:Hypothetical protein HINF_LOCUS63485 [Hexamita inflata]